MNHAKRRVWRSQAVPWKPIQGTDEEYLFLHVLVRDVAYGQIPRGERAEKHERAARWIERLGRAEDTAEMLAHHYVQALEYARASGRDTSQIEQPACAALTEAGARAYSLNAYEASERFTAAALELAEYGSPEWSRLVLQRVRALWHWRMFAAQAEIESACSDLERGGFTEEAAEAGSFLSWTVWIGGDRVRAKAAALHARDLLESAPPSQAKASVLNELGRLLAMEGTASAAEAIDATEQALAMATDLGLRELQISALNNRGIARSRTGDPEAFADIERSIELAREAGVGGTGIIRGYGNLASLVSLQGDLARAVGLHETAFAEARRVGMDSAIRWQQGEQIWFDFALGRWDDLMRHAEEWFAGRTGSSHFMDGMVRSRRAFVLAASGETAAAFEEDRLQVEQSAGQDPQSSHDSLSHSSFLHALYGERVVAEERLEQIVRAWGEVQGAPTFNPAELAFASALLDRTDAFLHVATRARPTRWLEGAVAFARHDYLKSAELYAEIGSLPNEAYARLATGTPTEVARALEFYRSVGAKSFVERAEALLPASA